MLGGPSGLNNPQNNNIAKEHLPSNTGTTEYNKLSTKFHNMPPNVNTLRSTLEPLCCPCLRFARNQTKEPVTNPHCHFVVMNFNSSNFMNSFPFSTFVHNSHPWQTCRNPCPLKSSQILDAMRHMACRWRGWRMWPVSHDHPPRESWKLVGSRMNQAGEKNATGTLQLWSLFISLKRFPKKKHKIQIAATWSYFVYLFLQPPCPPFWREVFVFFFYIFLGLLLPYYSWVCWAFWKNYSKIFWRTWQPGALKMIPNLIFQKYYP